MSPCDYDPFTKVKELLLRTTKEIRATGRSIGNINEDGRPDDVGRLPNIWQNMLNKEGDYIESTQMLYPHEQSHVRNIELLPLLLSNPSLTLKQLKIHFSG